MESFLMEIVKQGGFAALSVVCFLFALQKDKQVAALYDRLEEKSEKFYQKYAEITAELNNTISALAEVMDSKEKR